jgi:YVTN family beta-propeller protein
VVAALAVAVVAVMLLKPSGGGGDKKNKTGSGGSVKAELEVIGTIPVANFPDGVAVEGGHVWVASTGGQAVQRIDIATGKVDKFPLSGEPLAVTVGAGSVWVTQRNADKVARIDPATGNVVATIPVSHRPAFLVFANGKVWVSGGGGSCETIDPATNQTTPILTGRGNAAAIAVLGPNQPFVVSLPDTNEVLVHDPANGQEDVHIPVGKTPDFLVTAPSGYWVANRGEGTLSRIDKNTLKVTATVQVGGNPTGLAVDGDRIWAITQLGNGPGKLLMVDGPTGTVVDQVDVGRKPLGVITSPGRVWVTLSADNAVAQVQTP